MTEDNKVTNLDEARETSDKQASRPVLTLHGSGGIQVAVWKNKSEAGFDNYSIRLERSYKDGDNGYKSTAYLRDSDLLRAQKLLSEADDWIEQDKGRNRSSGAGRA